MKYIIEFEDTPLVRKKTAFGGSEYAVYKAKGFNALVFDQSGLNKLEPYDPDKIYKKGLDDAWEAAKRIVLGESEGGLSLLQIRKIFEVDYASRVLKSFDVLHVVNKLAYYDGDHEFNIGDEVESAFGIKSVIVDSTDEDRVWFVIDEGGCVKRQNEDLMKKTGRHFDEVQKLLDMMKEEEQ